MSIYSAEDPNTATKNFFLTQALPGHEYFRNYLNDRRRAESEDCNHYDLIDDAKHTLFTCPRWKNKRENFLRNTEEIFNAENMMSQVRNNSAYNRDQRESRWEQPLHWMRERFPVQRVTAGREGGFGYWITLSGQQQLGWKCKNASLKNSKTLLKCSYEWVNNCSSHFAKSFMMSKKKFRICNVFVVLKSPLP